MQTDRQGIRFGPGRRFDAQQPPMTAWAEAKFKATQDMYKQATGKAVVDRLSGGDPTYSCFPPGVPKIYFQVTGDARPMEIIPAKGRIMEFFEYDHFVRQIWTDGRLTPDDALLQASAILRHHLDVFVNFNEDVIEFDETPAGVSEENIKLKKLLNMSVNEIELSVRAANCLNNANITTVGQLAQKTEAEMLKYRNFGKKSLNEIKDKLQQLQLGLGMKFDPGLVDTPSSINGGGVNGSAQEEKK